MILNKLKCVLILITLIFFVTGCDKLKISIFTEIFPDGTAFRKVSYIYTPSDAEQLKFIYKQLPDILEKGFILPCTPSWEIKTDIKDNSFYYIAERKFDSLNDLRSDYCKKSSFQGSSQNFISFEKYQNSNITRYDFLEIFKDSADIKLFTQKFYEYLSSNKEKFVKKLYNITQEYISAFEYKNAEEIVSIFINKTAQFNQMLTGFHIVGPHERELINRELKRINNDINLGDFIDSLEPQNKVIEDSRLVKLFKLDDAKLTPQKRKAFYEKLKGFVKEEFTRIAQEYKVDPLGSYFTSLDMLNEYDFEYTLKMPGVITNSNGNRIDDNTIQWLFEPDDFFNHDYVIIAKSKVVN